MISQLSHPKGLTWEIATLHKKLMITLPHFLIKSSSLSLRFSNQNPAWINTSQTWVSNRRRKSLSRMMKSRPLTYVWKIENSTDLKPIRMIKGISLLALVRKTTKDTSLLALAQRIIKHINHLESVFKSPTQTLTLQSSKEKRLLINRLKTSIILW